tara:strand:- start:5 stop:172 length:168 start_codon:yes stop_codon:yes gene_type:complete
MNICSFEEELFMIVVVVRGGGKGEKVEGILSFFRVTGVSKGVVYIEADRASNLYL